MEQVKEIQEPARKTNLMIGGLKMFSEEFKAQIKQEFRTMIREEMAATLLEFNKHHNQQLEQLKKLPPFLTKAELKELLRIGDTKASELLGRSDFPVLREAGVLIPTHLFIQWVEANTQWIDVNTGLAPNFFGGLRAI